MMKRRRQALEKSLVRDARHAVENCAGLNARLAARRISHILDEHLAASGLSLAQFGLLAHIAAARDDTIGALAERCGLDQSTLSRNLRGLEKAGLIEIALVETDLRRRAVWLTEQGARLLEDAIPAWRRAHKALAKLVDANAVRKLAGALAPLGR